MFLRRTSWYLTNYKYTKSCVFRLNHRKERKWCSKQKQECLFSHVHMQLWRQMWHWSYFLHSKEHTLVYCLKPILKVRMHTVFQISLPLFSVSCIKRFIKMDWHKNVRFLIQYDHNDKLERERLFWIFYSIVLNDTF